MERIDPTPAEIKALRKFKDQRNVDGLLWVKETTMTKLARFAALAEKGWLWQYKGSDTPVISTRTGKPEVKRVMFELSALGFQVLGIPNDTDTD